jgi:hypothetical protein
MSPPASRTYSLYSQYESRSKENNVHKGQA